jgi:diguanylate cyclase (GGDEF)-like protein
VLTNSGGRAAWAVADRLRAQLADHRVRLQHEKTRAFHDVQVTFSAGVACFPHDGRSLESLMAAADSALYEAKRGGRNRVMQAGMEALPSPVPLESGPPPPVEDAFS